MAASPIAAIFVITMTMVFQALLFGDEYAADSFGALEDFNQECTETGPFAGLKCFFQGFVKFFKVLGAFIGFFFKFASLDVITGETPWPVRVISATLIITIFVWSITAVFRGN